MRICLLGDAGSVHIRRIATGLARRDHSVRVVSHKPGDIPGVSVERFAVPSFGWRHPVGWNRRLRAYLRWIMEAHDVVHLNFLHDWSLTLQIIEAGRLVVSPWGSDIVKPPDLDEYPAELVQMRRTLLQTADMVLVYGKAFVDSVASYAGLSVDAITSVPLGVDLELFRPTTRGSDDRTIVGFLKGFKSVYGPTVWMKAIPLVLSALPETRFEMVGDGPQLQQCQEMARKEGVTDAIVWMERIPHEQLPGVIGRWTLNVMPSLCEAFCVAALESSAVEVPVVASRVGGLTETVRDGETGLLVPPDDPEALARGVVELLSDLPRREAMAQAGREMVAREYEWEDCLDKLEDAYERVCATVCV
ncbi:MAG: glycosyltransferase family 4 protein [Phycisphaerales bacterium]|nr:MAG: glycosyltransferase family 4 protein [Phycisphaerales bacterium]